MELEVAAERERALPSTSLFPSGQNGQNWVKLKPEDSCGCHTWIQGFRDLGQPLLPSQHISKELDHKWSIWYLDQCHGGC